MILSMNTIFRLVLAICIYLELSGFHHDLLFDDVVVKAQAIYEKQNLTADSPVLFVGVDPGGVLAKILAMLTGHRGIAFLSLPITTELFQGRYDLDDNSRRLMTNIFNFGGNFGAADPMAGENFGIGGDPDVIGFDQVYPSFCNLAEMCGYHNQFSQYCETAIGSDKLSAIREYLGLPPDDSQVTL
jgi:hypothetical protein